MMMTWSFKNETERREKLSQLTLSLLLPFSLINVNINGFSIEDRIDLIIIFLAHATHLQTLIVHQAIPRISSSIENELDDIKNLPPPSLCTFIY